MERFHLNSFKNFLSGNAFEALFNDDDEITDEGYIDIKEENDNANYDSEPEDDHFFDALSDTESESDDQVQQLVTEIEEVDDSDNNDVNDMNREFKRMKTALENEWKSFTFVDDEQELAAFRADVEQGNSIKPHIDKLAKFLGNSFKLLFTQLPMTVNFMYMVAFDPINLFIQQAHLIANTLQQASVWVDNRILLIRNPADRARLVKIRNFLMFGRKKLSFASRLMTMSSKKYAHLM